MFPKIVGFTPKSSMLIRFSIIFTIHFWGNFSYFRKHREYFFVEITAFSTWQRLAENLHVIDFEQLKIENQQLNVGIPVIPSVSSYVLCSCLALKQNKLVLICQEIFRKHCTFVQTFPSYTYFYITLNVCRRLSSRKRLKKEMKSSTSLLLKIGTVPGPPIEGR